MTWKEEIKKTAELYPEQYDNENPSLNDMRKLGGTILMHKWNLFKLKVKEKLGLIK